LKLGFMVWVLLKPAHASSAASMPRPH